jgi:serine/threonine protein phosphatase 1
MLIFAIGDVHGCYDKLMLLAQYRSYIDRRPYRFIFLGDYIDRGPNSRAVIELLMELQTSADPPCIFLWGNHEQMLL